MPSADQLTEVKVADAFQFAVIDAAMLVQTSVSGPSGVVPPNVSLKVGAAAPEVPAVVTTCAFPSGSKRTVPAAYALLAVQTSAVIVALAPRLVQVAEPSVVGPPATAFQAGCAGEPVTPAVVTTCRLFAAS